MSEKQGLGNWFELDNSGSTLLHVGSGYRSQYQDFRDKQVYTCPFPRTAQDKDISFSQLSRNIIFSTDNFEMENTVILMQPNL